MKNTVKTIFLLLVVFLFSAGSAVAGTYELWHIAQGSLSHSDNYVYGIENTINLSGETIVGAQLTIKRLYENTSNDVLYINLLDNSYQLNGKETTPDHYNSSYYGEDWFDRTGNPPWWWNSYYHWDENEWSYDKKYNKDPHISLTDITDIPESPAQDISYDFSSDQVSTLIAYLENENHFGLGFDPDCHYYFDGMTLTITTSEGGGSNPVPEPATMLLVGTGLLGLAGIRRKKMKKD